MTNPTPTRFSRWLRDRRRQMKLSQGKLAELLGVGGYQRVMFWESGRYQPNTAALLLIAKWAETDVERLVRMQKAEP